MLNESLSPDGQGLRLSCGQFMPRENRLLPVSWARSVALSPLDRMIQQEDLERARVLDLGFERDDEHQCSLRPVIGSKMVGNYEFNKVVLHFECSCGRKTRSSK